MTMSCLVMILTIVQLACTITYYFTKQKDYFYLNIICFFIILLIYLAVTYLK